MGRIHFFLSAVPEIIRCSVLLTGIKIVNMRVVPHVNNLYTGFVKCDQFQIVLNSNLFRALPP